MGHMTYVIKNVSKTQYTIYVEITGSSRKMMSNNCSFGQPILGQPPHKPDKPYMAVNIMCLVLLSPQFIFLPSGNLT